MGRGIALQFKRAFPDNFKAYAARCKRNQVRPGQVYVFETGTIVPPQYIVNFPTKRHWRGKSQIEDIESGLESLVEEIRSRRIRSIAIPPLGSGLGGLDWRSVRTRMETVLDALEDVEIVIFEPGGGPAGSRTSRLRDVPKMTPGQGGAGGVAGPISARLAGSVRHVAGSTQAHVLHAGCRRAVEAEVHEGALRTIRRRPPACPARNRRAFRVRLRRWRGCAQPTVAAGAGSSGGCARISRRQGRHAETPGIRIRPSRRIRVTVRSGAPVYGPLDRPE